MDMRCRRPGCHWRGRRPWRQRRRAAWRPRELISPQSHPSNPPTLAPSPSAPLAGTPWTQLQARRDVGEQALVGKQGGAGLGWAGRQTAGTAWDARPGHLRPPPPPPQPAVLQRLRWQHGQGLQGPVSRPGAQRAAGCHAAGLPRVVLWVLDAGCEGGGAVAPQLTVFLRLDQFFDLVDCRLRRPLLLQLLGVQAQLQSRVRPGPEGGAWGGPPCAWAHAVAAGVSRQRASNWLCPQSRSMLQAGAAAGQHGCSADVPRPRWPRAWGRLGHSQAGWGCRPPGALSSMRSTRAGAAARPAPRLARPAAPVWPGYCSPLQAPQCPAGRGGVPPPRAVAADRAAPRDLP